MRLSAFDPRVRTLNGVRLSAFDPRVRTLNGLRGLRLGCDQCKQGPLSGLRGRLRGFGRFGDFEPSSYDPGTSLIPPDYGVIPFPAPPVTVDTTDVPVTGTLQQPSYSTTLPLLSPQQQLAQQYYGTTNLMQLTPAQSAAIMAAAPASASGIPALTAGQIQQLKNAQVSLPGSIGGISTSTLFIGLAGVLALGFAFGGRR